LRRAIVFLATMVVMLMVVGGVALANQPIYGTPSDDIIFGY
jgi:hypothetical protein